MADGDVLYYQGEYPAGTAGITVGAFQSDVRLETQFGYPPPPGQALCLHNGRIYIAQGPVVWQTVPLRVWALTGPTGTSCRRSPRRFACMASVTDGLYVATEAATYFDSGIDTEAIQPAQVLPYGAAAGRAVEGAENATASRGFRTAAGCSPGPAGQVKNAMEERNAVSKFRAGAGLFRETNGVRQFLAVLRDGEASGLMAQDYVDFEMARRGSRRYRIAAGASRNESRGTLGLGASDSSALCLAATRAWRA